MQVHCFIAVFHVHLPRVRISSRNAFAYSFLRIVLEFSGVRIGTVISRRLIMKDRDISIPAGIDLKAGKSRLTI
jgi:hypothetical protein